MDNYMAAADRKVGKASTTSECPARAWPMALSEPIPVREEPECRPFARSADALEQFPRSGLEGCYSTLTTRLVSNRMREPASKLGKPAAAAAVAEDALRLLD